MNKDYKAFLLGYGVSVDKNTESEPKTLAETAINTFPSQNNTNAVSPSSSNETLEVLKQIAGTLNGLATQVAANTDAINKMQKTAPAKKTVTKTGTGKRGRPSTKRTESSTMETLVHSMG